MASSSQSSKSWGSSGTATLEMEVWRGTDLEEVVVVQHGLTIGSADHNTISVNEPDVDIIHARVLRRESGFFELAGAGIGSLLWDARSEHDVERIVLQDGTKVRLGTVTLLCRQILTGQQTAGGEEWARRCPRCHEQMENTGDAGERNCPACQFPLQWMESGGFAGWLPCEAGPYQIKKIVARGGMGIVTHATHRTKLVSVALKFPLLPSGTELEHRARFQGEVEILRDLQHPNLVHLREAGNEGKLSWLAHDWIEGESLAELLRRKKSSSETFAREEVDDIIGQIAKGLGFLHGKGIVHRDLKPSNILIGLDRSVKLADFGLARSLLPDANAGMMTQTGSFAGTMAYCSPEQSAGEPITTASDIYSLGIVWLELLTKRTILGNIPSGTPLREDCSPEYSTLMTSCLLPKPTDRPKADALQEDITSKADERPDARVNGVGNWFVALRKGYIPTSASWKKSVLEVWENRRASIRCVVDNVRLLEPILSRIRYVASHYWELRTVLERFVALIVGLALVGWLFIPGKKISDPIHASKNKPFVNTLGMEFVPVPRTSVLFCRTETRVRDFKAFVDEKPYRQSGGIEVMDSRNSSDGSLDFSWDRKPDVDWFHPGFKQGLLHPVVGVSWKEANLFCEWLSQKEGKKYRLPTDDEWSAAVGSDQYPWGNDLPIPSRAGNYGDRAFFASLPGKRDNGQLGKYNDGAARTAEVASYAANSLGIYDLGGNVSEWCEDEYKATLNNQDDLKDYPLLKEESKDGTAFRVLRGASWFTSDQRKLSSMYRLSASPVSPSNDYGFRCVLDVGLSVKN